MTTNTEQQAIKNLDKKLDGILKFQFEPENKEIKKALDNLERLIKKNYGKQCKDLASGCSTCQVYSAFKTLKLCL